jgi:internalin A
VFVSYAREDEEHLRSLEPHLATLVRKQAISVWHDAHILPGADWEREILERLERADVVLLLVSASFMASDYVWSVELEQALERHRAGLAVVIPIIVRPTLWRNTPLRSLNALPLGGKAVTTWANQDEAWVDVAAGIERLLASST